MLVLWLSIPLFFFFWSLRGRFNLIHTSPFRDSALAIIMVRIWDHVCRC
jgi:hypothetical protein